MKFSKSWLKELIDFDLSTEGLVEKLTMVGLEVGSVESVAPKFHGVVVGEVVATASHPNADKLTLCKVNIGNEDNLDIVCGASNVRPKLKVAVASVGAELPGDFKIKRAKIRGQESAGMLCSAVELGLPEVNLGIIELSNDAPVGMDIRKYLELDDEVIDVELTANRGDCLSMLGIAREVRAIHGSELKRLLEKEFTVTQESLPVEVKAKEGCPRYCGRVIRGINNRTITPIWMKERLRRLGIGSINFVVDVTNYVMLELGQPLHAFDLAKLDKKIEVRYARKDERIELLDGNEIELNDKTLVIADNSQPLAIAGVMGGSSTGVLEESVDIFLESAFFSPEKISLQARYYGLQTDSSYRFERGVDYELQRKALDRATSLIVEIAGGDCGKITEVVFDEHLPNKSDVTLSRKSVENILGISIDDDKISSIFNRLGIKADVVSNGWRVGVPSFRFDLEIVEDLVEELARIYGYHMIPEQKIVTELGVKGGTSEKSDKDRLCALMVDLGYREVVTYSFIDAKLQELFGGGMKALFLSNPLSSEQSVMRTTLWPGLVDVVKYNLKRQQKRGRFFEIGMRFLPKEDGELEQKFVIGGVNFGDLYPEQWGIEEKGNKTNFFDLKNDVEKILRLFVGDDVEYTPESHGALHPGCSAAIHVSGKPEGFIGEIHPIVREELGIDRDIYLFELDLACLLSKPKTAFKPFSKYPQIVRDIAIIASKDILWSQIKQKIVDISKELLHNTTVFDVYCNENIGLDKKSMAIRLTFQNVDRTLVDVEIDQLMDKVILVLKQTFNVSLRG